MSQFAYDFTFEKGQIIDISDFKELFAKGVGLQSFNNLIGISSQVIFLTT